MICFGKYRKSSAPTGQYPDRSRRRSRRADGQRVGGGAVLFRTTSVVANSTRVCAGWPPSVRGFQDPSLLDAFDLPQTCA